MQPAEPDLHIQLIAIKYSLMAKILSLVPDPSSNDYIRDSNALKAEFTLVSGMITDYSYSKARDYLIRRRLSK